ncbi:MAG: phosphate transport system substrate-binding protein [Pseudomonadota bacterium]|nr:phosphate transport system substrate-binding protein [Pseudomonadota bacterium]
MNTTQRVWRMQFRHLLAIAALLIAPPLMAAEPLRIGGTGSGTTLLKVLAETYQKTHPGTTFDIIQPTLGSSGGLRALAAGRIDIAISGRPPRDEEGRFTTLEYARSPLVFASGSQQKPVNFSRREIADIYAGKRQKWPDGEPIRLVLRSPFESDTLTLRQLGPEISAAVDEALKRKAGPVGENDLDAIELIAKLPGSLGLTTLGLIRLLEQPLTIHTLDGTQPSVEMLSTGIYPLAKSLFLNTRVQQDAATADFVAFLQSAPARKLLLQLGHQPGFR